MDGPLQFPHPTPLVASSFTVPHTPLTINYELHGSGSKKVLLIMVNKCVALIDWQSVPTHRTLLVCRV
jgi:hypothetical protein